ncbi:MAG: SDR family NAD(P)-dependent oxidoreductase [Myxococcaceae bacterium]|jgi:NAD(P)-dependent dehydrogenase (short-subunit alcohol dehydrogenase family)|nr:SDR family NAD(P)-dependent oxidoreductase [Myxococcaceae bacterium]
MPSNTMRWVVVTGASSGIGRAVVERASRQGFGVVACVRKTSRAPFTPSRSLRLVQVDVRREPDVARLRRAVARLPLAGLVNAAGLAFAAPLEWTSARALRDLLDVNVVGVQRITKALAPRLRPSQGRVVNLSSGAGLVTSPFTAAYSASKFALESLSDGWRMELARDGVPVTLIEPGPVATPLWDRVEAQMRQTRRRAEPSVRAHWEAPWATAVTVLAQARATAIDPDVVAAQVLEALTAPRPPVRMSATSREELAALLAMDELERDRAVALPWGL